MNYWIGHLVGPQGLPRRGSRFLNREHLERTHRFYEKHGGKTIIIARFMPIIRTFAPFVAGIGSMNYARFIALQRRRRHRLGRHLRRRRATCSATSPMVKRNFTLVIMVIIVISVLPGVVEFVRHRRRAVAARGVRDRGGEAARDRAAARRGTALRRMSPGRGRS